MSTKLSFGLLIALATAALAFDDCILINFGEEDDEDSERRDQDVPPHLRADAAAA